VSRHHPSVLSLLEPSPRRTCALGSSRWRRAAAADAAGDKSMLACARSRAGSSSSACATWAWPRRGCRHSKSVLAPVVVTQNVFWSLSDFVFLPLRPPVSLVLPVRNRTLTLIERKDDTRSWGNFLVYFSHSTTMPCPPRGWGYILIGC
jgi:hypothetical protein